MILPELFEVATVCLCVPLVNILIQPVIPFASILAACCKRIEKEFVELFRLIAGEIELPLAGVSNKIFAPLYLKEVGLKMLLSTLVINPMFNLLLPSKPLHFNVLKVKK